jgi:hypothetical protein
MDIEDIRSLIRSSLKRQIRELATSSKKIPESYKEFHSRIIRHLVSLKVPDTVVERLEY